MSIEGNAYEALLTDSRPLDINALKAIGQGRGTNTSGFSALLAGYSRGDGTFGALGGFGYFWSSTRYDATTAHYLVLRAYTPTIYLISNYETYGFSVRCLED